MARAASPTRPAAKQEQRTPQHNGRREQQQQPQQPSQKEVQDRLTSLRKAKAAAPVDTHDFLDT